MDKLSDERFDRRFDKHLGKQLGKTLDPLSQAFSLLDVRAARCTRFEAGGHWSYRFPAKPALKFGAVIRGDCWIDFGDEAHHWLATGDCFLLANAPAYVLANDERLTPEDGIAAFDWAQSDVARGAGSDTVLLAGSFGFEASDAELLLDALPRFLLIPSRSPSAAVIHSTLHILDLEIRGTGIGTAVLTDRLADVLLVQVLRAALDQGAGEGLGWINALVDARIGKAIRLMHEDAAHPWTLEALADAIAMSRSAFSKRFKSLVGWRRSTTSFGGECGLRAISCDVVRPSRQPLRSWDIRRRVPSGMPSNESTAMHRSDTGVDRPPAKKFPIAPNK